MTANAPVITPLIKGVAMLELFEKVIMTSIGVAVITQKKAEELATELKERYKLSEDEGKHLVDRLQYLAKESRDKTRHMAEVEVKKAIERLGLVSRDEFNRLLMRIQELESRYSCD